MHYKLLQKTTHLWKFQITSSSATFLWNTSEIFDIYYLYNSKVLNENLHMGIIAYIKDCYCYSYNIKKASGTNGKQHWKIIE